MRREKFISRRKRWARKSLWLRNENIRDTLKREFATMEKQNFLFNARAPSWEVLKKKESFPLSIQISRNCSSSENWKQFEKEFFSSTFTSDFLLKRVSELQSVWRGFKQTSLISLSINAALTSFRDKMLIRLTQHYIDYDRDCSRLSSASSAAKLLSRKSLSIAMFDEKRHKSHYWSSRRINFLFNYWNAFSCWSCSLACRICIETFAVYFSL